MAGFKELVGKCSEGHDGQLRRNKKTGKVHCEGCSQSEWWGIAFMGSYGRRRFSDDYAHGIVRRLGMARELARHSKIIVPAEVAEVCYLTEPPSSGEPDPRPKTLIHISILPAVLKAFRARYSAEAIAVPVINGVAHIPVQKF